MESQRVLDTLGQILKEKNCKKHSRIKWISMAVCLCLVFAVGIFSFDYSAYGKVKTYSNHDGVTQTDNSNDTGNNFADILGLNDYYVKVEETPPGFMIWRYFTKLDGKTQCIAEVFGYTASEPEVYSKDIDGDGVKELICNCTFGTGTRRVYIYRNNNGVILQGTLAYDTNDSSLFPNLNNWGSNAINETYDPENDTFVISYSTENGTEQAVFKDMNIISFRQFSPDIVN